MLLLHKTAQIISQPLTLHSTTRKRMQHNPHQKLPKPRLEYSHSCCTEHNKDMETYCNIANHKTQKRVLTAPQQTRK